jgi:hypothetical protein
MAFRRLLMLVLTLIILACAGCTRRQFLPLASKQFTVPGQPQIAQEVSPTASTPPTFEAGQNLSPSPLALEQTQPANSTPPPTQTTSAKIMLPYLSKPALPTQPPWRLASHTLRGNKQNDRFILQLEYPIVVGAADLRLDGLTQQIQNWINSETNQFLQNVQTVASADVNGFMVSTYSIPSSSTWSPNNSDPNSQSTPAELESSQAIWNSGKPVISILFTINEYYGGVHPDQRHAAINYNLETGESIALDDLFLPSVDYLSVIARFATTELYRRPELIPQEIDRGAAPSGDNYKIWNITPLGLLITFEEYQVGPYAAGPQQVLIPYNALVDILRPDGPLRRSGRN